MVAHPVALKLGEQVRDAVAGFGRDPEAARRHFAALLAADASEFRAAVLAALPAIGDVACRRCLLELLLEHALVPACDPSIYTLAQETAIVRELAQIDPSLDLKLARRFSRSARPMSDAVAQRTLGLLGEVANHARVLPLIIRLLSHPNPRLRSKAALIICRSHIAPHTAEHLSAERDARVRANAIEALWGSDTRKIRGALREAAADGSNRVAGNALLGLFRLGDTWVIPRIAAMAASADPKARATAAWVMERTGNPRFLPALARMVGEETPRTRTRVFHAIAALNRAARRFAQAPPLRVHILSTSVHMDGKRVVRAGIATACGAAVEGLAFTGIALSENAREVADYTVRRHEAPGPLSFGLLLPESGAADRIAGILGLLKRPCDRLQVARYPAGGALEAIPRLVAQLGPRASILVVAADFEGTAAEPQAHMISAADMDAAERACEKLYLGRLHPFDIVYRSAAPSPALKLEVFAPEGYGVDVS